MANRYERPETGDENISAESSDNTNNEKELNLIDIVRNDTSQNVYERSSYAAETTTADLAKIRITDEKRRDTTEDNQRLIDYARAHQGLIRELQLKPVRPTTIANAIDKIIDAMAVDRDFVLKTLHLTAFYSRKDSQLHDIEKYALKTFAESRNKQDPEKYLAEQKELRSRIFGQIGRAENEQGTFWNSQTNRDAAATHLMLSLKLDPLMTREITKLVSETSSDSQKSFLDATLGQAEVLKRLDASGHLYPLKTYHAIDKVVKLALSKLDKRTSESFKMLEDMARLDKEHARACVYKYLGDCLQARLIDYQFDQIK